jgi:hypothetical protein
MVCVRRKQHTSTTKLRAAVRPRYRRNPQSLSENDNNNKHTTPPSRSIKRGLPTLNCFSPSHTLPLTSSTFVLTHTLVNKHIRFLQTKQSNHNEVHSRCIRSPLRRPRCRRRQLHWKLRRTRLSIPSTRAILQQACFCFPISLCRPQQPLPSPSIKLQG